MLWTNRCRHVSVLRSERPSRVTSEKAKTPDTMWLNSPARAGCLARCTPIEFQMIAENNNVGNRFGSLVAVRSRILIGLVGRFMPMRQEGFSYDNADNALQRSR